MLKYIVLLCFVQSENFCNLKIALHILRILRLHSSLEIGQPFQKLRNYHMGAISSFRDLHAQLNALMLKHLTVSDLLS